MAGEFVAGSIVSHIVLNTSQWEDSVKRVNADQKEMGGMSDKTARKFRKVGTAMTVAGGIIIGSLAAQISKASDAEETFSKFGTVFEGAFGQASIAAENLAANYGLSELKSKDLLAATGDLLTGMGANSAQALDLSEKTQQLAVDLASFTNFSGGAEGASRALTKAMLGERESLKSLGIVVSEAMIKQKLMEKGQQNLTGQALMQAKAYATLEIATDQSKNAIGDFARTSGSFANQQRVLQARLEDLRVEIGTQLLPIATKIVSKFAEIVTKVTDWTKKNPGLTNTIVKITAVVGGLLVTLGPILIILPKIMTGFGAIAKLVPALVGGVGALGKAFVFLATNPIGLLILALGALVIGYMKVKAAQDKANESAMTADEVNRKYMEKLKGAALQAGMTAAEFYDLAKAYDNNAAALGNAIRKGEEGVEIQKSLAEVGAESAEVYNEQKATMELSVPTMKDFNAALGDIGTTTESTAEKQKAWIDYINSLGLQTIKEKGDRVNELEGYLEILHEQYKQGTIDIDTYRTAIETTEKEIKDLSTIVVDTAIPAARDWGVAITEAMDGGISKTQEFTGAVEEETTKVETRWDGMWTNIESKSASIFSDMLSGTVSFGDGFKGILGTIKQGFSDTLGDMLAEFTTKFLKGLLSGATDAISGLGDTIGSAIGGLFGGGGEGGGEGGGGIGGLIGGGGGGIISPWTTIAAGLGGMLGGMLGGGKDTHYLKGIRENTWKVWKETGNVVNNVDKIKWTTWEIRDLTVHTMIPIMDSIKKSFWQANLQIDAIKRAAWKRNNILRRIAQGGAGGGGGEKPAPGAGGGGGGGGDTAMAPGAGGGSSPGTTPTIPTTPPPTIPEGPTAGGGGGGNEPGTEPRPGGRKPKVEANIFVKNVFKFENQIDPNFTIKYVEKKVFPIMLRFLNSNQFLTAMKEALGVS